MPGMGMDEAIAESHHEAVAVGHPTRCGRKVSRAGPPAAKTGRRGPALLRTFGVPFAPDCLIVEAVCLFIYSGFSVVYVGFGGWI